jgi:hypothetical protein
MSKRKSDIDNYDESLQYIIGTGSYSIWRENVRGRPKQDKRIVGFVRPKMQKVKQKRK